MAAIDFPPLASAGETWPDPNGQTWMSNGDAWVRTKLGSGISEPSPDGNQYSRQRDDAQEPGKWIRVAIDVWYLGPYPDNPTLNNDGNLLVEGNVYYNTTTDIMMSYDGVEWRAFAPTLQVFGLTQYTYDFSVTAPPPGTPVSGPDVYNNTPIGWNIDETVVEVFMDGVRMVHQRDAAIIGGNYTINYANSQITPIGAWPIGTLVIIVSKKDSDRYIAAEDESAEDWNSVVKNFADPVDHTKLVTKQGIKTYVDTQLLSGLGSINTGYKNQIINGDFRVNQRTIWNFSSRGYFADRWYNHTSAQTLQVRGNGNTTLPFDRYVRVHRTDDHPGRYIYQGIELPRIGHPGQFIRGSVWTLSFWTSSSTSGDAHVSIQFTDKMSNFAPEIVYSERIVDIGAEWKKVTMTFTMPANVVPKSTDTMLRLNISIKDLPGNTDTASFSNIQLERGAVASEFEYRNTALEMILCQRYYSNDILIAASGYADKAGQTSSCLGSATFPTTMRVIPDIEITTLSRQNYSGYPFVVTAAKSSITVSMVSGAAGRMYYRAKMQANAELPI